MRQMRENEFALMQNTQDIDINAFLVCAAICIILQLDYTHDMTLVPKKNIAPG